MHLLPPSICQCSVSRIFKIYSYTGHRKVETDIEVTEDRTGDPLLQKPCTSQLSYACKCWFLRRGENQSIRGKTSLSRVKNQQTQPTYGVESGNRSWATLVEGEYSHHGASPAPQKRQSTTLWFVLKSNQL